MDSEFNDHLARLHDAGVISTEELQAARDWQSRKSTPQRGSRPWFRLGVAATVALLAALLILLDVTLAAWVTTAVVILAVAFLVPQATGNRDQ